MVFLKVGAAVNPRGAYRNEIHIVCHYLCKFVAIVFGKSIAEGLWKFAESLLIGLGLGIDT